jgi:alpha-L-rhamnosidase
MGLLRPEEWQAQWIGLPGLPDPGPCPFLRKEFTLRKPLRRARLYAAALGVYELSLNGERVGHDILAPGWTDYRKRALYQTYDVTRQLRRSRNAIGAILGDGWYAGALGWELKRHQFGAGPARLRGQLVVEYADGSRETIGTDGSWEAAPGPILESDLYGGEIYDARRGEPGWNEPGFGPKSGAWKHAAVFTDANPELDAESCSPIRVTQELAAKRVTEPQPGVFIFDLGQNIVGWARLRARGPAGTTVTLRFGEVLNPDGTLYRANLRRARATDIYTLAGRGEEIWEPRFTYHGFRYVEVTGYPGRPALDAISGRVFHSAMPETSRFTCSDPMVNRLFDNILWGQRGNLMSVPTDCPQRDERLGWMGDAQIFARTACFNMEMAPFFTKWMRDIVDAQSRDGAFSDVSPRVIDPADGAPAWAEAGIVVPWTVYQCYGDTRILERNFDAMARYVDLLHWANPDLLWLQRRNNDFGDWVSAGGVTPKELIASAYFARDLRMVAEMARAIGRSVDAAKYGRLADLAAAAFNARFLSMDNRYLGDSQTGYAMAIGLELAPRDRRSAIGERLVEAVHRRQDHLDTGFIGTSFLLPALSTTGHTDLAYRLLLNRDYPSWGYTIAKGATTVWELWNSDSQGPGMNSRNHFSFGSVGEWIQRFMLGIDTDPSAPGYAHLLVRPHPGDGLTEARGEYLSIRGPISAGWRAEPDGYNFDLTVPANTTATVDLPKTGGSAAEVTEGGKPVWRDGRFASGDAGVSSAQEAADRIVLEVGSGRYSFRIVHRH